MSWSVANRYGQHVSKSIIGLVVLAPLALAAGPDTESRDRGERLFHKRWVHDGYKDPVLEIIGDVVGSADEIGDGLGPMYNATSCQACHASGGASDVNANVTMITLDPRSEVFKQEHNIGTGRRHLMNLFPGVFSPSGLVVLDAVVHNHSVREEYAEIRDRLAEFVPEDIPKSWFVPALRRSEAIAARPVIAGRHESVDFYLSQRNSPPLFGLGLIDQISTDTLRTISLRQARSSGGKISGRLGPGKFGLRAQTTTLEAFVRGACTGELGLSQQRVAQPLDPTNWQYVNRGIDISEKDCKDLTNFVASLSQPISLPPTNRIQGKEGKRQFYRLGCAVCHVENVDPVSGLYSDLLLHDMGPKLQAPSPAPSGPDLSPNKFFNVKIFIPNRAKIFRQASTAGYYGTPPSMYPLPFAIDRPVSPQFPRGEIVEDIWNPSKPEDVTWDALQREWRTAPLWGLVDSGPYLHDGRARTIDEAIRMHGGEAKESAEAYGKMSERNREKLMVFLRTLASPHHSLHLGDVAMD